MKAREIMTPDPAYCTPETPLLDVAQMFIEHDCGAIPVVESESVRRPVGIVTDRDIACRAVAAGRNALELSAQDCMSTPCLSVTAETSLSDCCMVMETSKVRRLVVVDTEGRCCGIVSQADIALRGHEKRAGEVVREISRPSLSASNAP